MNGFSLNTTAHPRLYPARLHPSRRRVPAATTFETDANQRNFSDKRGFVAIRSVLPRPSTLLRAERSRFYSAATMGITSFTSPSISAGFHYQAN